MVKSICLAERKMMSSLNSFGNITLQDTLLQKFNLQKASNLLLETAIHHAFLRIF
jgi:hypothetical protein